MQQLNKMNQDNKLLKKAYKEKIQQNQKYTAKAKSSAKDTGSKAYKAGKHQTGKQKADNDRIALASLQTISASQMAEYEPISE